MAKKELGENYVLNETVDLAVNKKQFVIVNVLSLVLMLLTLGVGFLWKGFELGDDYIPILISSGILIVGYIVYMILHELTHGVVMYAVSKDKPDFGVKLPFYAYAGTDRVYFGKWEYIFIALAPVAVWGVVFGVLCAFLEGPFFWAVMFLQSGNIGGAAGDFFVTAKTLTYKRDVFIKDTGVNMQYFVEGAKSEDTEEKTETTEEKEEAV